MKLLSCIMPSKRSASTVRRALQNFREQTYPAKELVIVRVWDGFDPSWHDELRVNEKLVYLEHAASIGELRNIAIRNASGSVVGHHDDDDHSHPERLARSMAAIDAGASLVGSSRVIFEKTYCDSCGPPYCQHARRYLFDGAALTPKYLVGGTLVYRRELWERQNFLDVQQGEDSKWQWWHWKRVRAHNPYGTGAWADLADETLYTATISDDATSPKDPESPGWSLL